MQNSQIPAKWLKPFAADDPNKVEIPLTSGDATRASQSLGFPPLTMQPPESGGVPPQGEDFNGAMNQVARIVWWLMAGGAVPFDNTWATDAAIGGYPQGAAVAAADLLGDWLSTANNNTADPDTNGAGWVPGYSYGATTVSGLGNTNVTLSPAQAMKNIVVLTGTLTGNIQVIFPPWVKTWTIVNQATLGTFTITAKTAAGGGAVVPFGQTRVRGDGTNLILATENIALAPQYDESGAAASTAWVRRHGLQSSASFFLTTSQTLSAAQAGGTIIGGSATAITLTLPTTASYPDGGRLEFINVAAGVMTVARQGADQINVGSTSVTTLALAAGDTLTVVRSGSSWVAVDGSAQTKYSPGFGAVLSNTGYQKFPSGLILQWGAGTTGGGSNFSAIFPIVFPNTLLAGFATNAATTAPGSFGAIQYQNAGGMTVWAASSSGVGTGAGAAYYWFAIGW